MEIELKYNIPHKETALAIWNDNVFSDFEEPDSRENITLNAKYFDTSDCDLAKNEIAYRIRSENNHLVATIKWKGHSEDGLHMREEINVPVDSEEPDVEVFSESKVGCKVMALLRGRPLKCFLETKIQRQSFRIDNEEGIFELSIDEGSIITEYGEVPVLEVEVELYSGETEALVKIGKILEEKYGLIPEDGSKYSRGMKMIKEAQSR